MAPGASAVMGTTRNFFASGLSPFAQFVNFRVGPHAKAKRLIDQTVRLTAFDSEGTSYETSVVITHAFEQQHTIMWKSEVKLGGVTLDPASCNLYTFPATNSINKGERGAIILTGQRLELACRIILAAATAGHDAAEEGGGAEALATPTWDDEPASSFTSQNPNGKASAAGGDASEADDLCLRPDCSGAYVLHSLLLANTSPSIALAMAIYNARPRLLLQVHADGPFTGEHGLHILAVNRRELELCTLVRLAVSAARAPAARSRKRPWASALGPL